MKSRYRQNRRIVSHSGKTGWCRAASRSGHLGLYGSVPLGLQWSRLNSTPSRGGRGGQRGPRSHKAWTPARRLSAQPQRKPERGARPHPRLLCGQEVRLPRCFLGPRHQAGPAPGGTSSRQGWGTSPRCRSLPGPNPESPMWWGRIQSEKMDNDHQDEGTGEGRGQGRDVPTREAPRAREARAHPAGARGRRSGNTLSRRRRRLRAAGTGTFFLILTLNLKSFQQECTVL